MAGLVSLDRHARVEAVHHQVGDEVAQHRHGADGQCDAQYQRMIAVDRRRHDQATEPRQREHRFDGDGAHEGRANATAHHGEDRMQRIHQRMASPRSRKSSPFASAVTM